MVRDIFDRFVKEVPAAVMFRSLIARVFSDERMNQLFRQHKQRQVEGDLLFSTLLHLLTPVVHGSKPSVHAAYQAMEEQVGVSTQAVYEKLQGVEPAVCEALVRVPAAELGPVQQKAKALKADPIPGYHLFIIDGKRLDGTEHRLKETRRMKSAPLPGTVLVMLDTRLEMFVDAACDPDAYACERKVVEPMLERLDEGSVAMADRNFCDGPLIQHFGQRKAFFVLRQHGRSPRWRKAPGSVRRKIGQDGRGGTVYEQEIEALMPDGSWARLRRITIQLAEPTRDDDTELHLLTNLPASVSAILIADAYRERWTIETCLGYLAQALNAEINTLAYPGAALLCFCLALTLFNMLSTLKALLHAFSKDSDPPQVSYYYLALEIVEAHLGIEIAIEKSYWKRYARMPLAEYVAFLKSVARHANLRRYRKHPRGPKRPPPKRTSGKRRAHVSSYRILEARTC